MREWGGKSTSSEPQCGALAPGHLETLLGAEQGVAPDNILALGLFERGESEGTTRSLARQRDLRRNGHGQWQCEGMCSPAPANERKDRCHVIATAAGAAGATAHVWLLAGRFWKGLPRHPMQWKSPRAVTCLQNTAAQRAECTRNEAQTLVDIRRAAERWLAATRSAAAEILGVEEVATVALMAALAPWRSVDESM